MVIAMKKFLNAIIIPALALASSNVRSYEPLNIVGVWNAIVQFDSASVFFPIPDNIWATTVFSGSYLSRSGSWYNKCGADMSVSFAREPYGIFPPLPLRFRVRIDSISVTSGTCSPPTFSDPFLITNIDAAYTLGASFLADNLSPNHKANGITAVLPRVRVYEIGGSGHRDFHNLNFTYFNNRSPFSIGIQPSILYISTYDGSDYFFFRGIAGVPDIDIY